jgi:4-hydroxybenzoyl-CoA reductase subunit beta
MMRLPAFTYLAPRTVGEAATMIAENGPAATVVAGGTDVYPAMKRRQTAQEVLVGLRGVEGLRGISAGDGGDVTIGAMTPLRQIAAADALHPALVTAARSVSSPQIRNVATIGGNLCLQTRCNYYDVNEGIREAVQPCLKAGGDTCWVAPGGDRCWAMAASDLAPVAVALDAEAHFTGAEGDRVVAAAEMYTGDGLAPFTRAPDEILTRVVFPAVDGLSSVYWKLARRGTIDFPLLGVAVALRLAPDGVCTHARIVLGAVASAPLRAVEAEDLLLGNALTPELIEAAGTAAARPAKPLDNADLPHYYRKWTIPVGVRRALSEAAGLQG